MILADSRERIYSSARGRLVKMAKDIILVAILTTLVLLWTETVECTLWDFYSKEHILRVGEDLAF